MTSWQRQKTDRSTLNADGVYSLEFSPLAKKEYDRLEKVVQIQRLKKLKSRLHEPRVQADKLRNMPNCYKVKLRALGVRLVYEVIDRRLVVSVVAVGRRDNDAIYERAKGRIGRPD